MKWAEQKEFDGIVKRIGPVVLSTVSNRWGDASASELRRSVGVLVTTSDSLETFGPLFVECMSAARLNGATYQTMGRVRIAALAEAPVYLPGVQLVQMIVRLCLASEARLVSAIEFTSRDDVQQVTDAINAAFSVAAEVASDALDAATYMSITSLHATVTKYLADRARALPRIVPFKFPQTMPVLRMSQQLYGTGSRSDELRLENKVVHPAFCPREMKALAV